MYPIPPNEILVEMKGCKKCQVSFPITDKDLEFYDKISPVFAGKKYPIPTPTLCPDCRQQGRLSFRNERKLYKRKCDATKQDIVSIYSPDKPYTVYHQDYWWSDTWDPMEFGREFDFERGFFEQFGELMGEVPRPSTLNAHIENSPYINYSSYIKNGYLIFDTVNGEDLMYGNNGEGITRCIDFGDSRQCSECYEILDCSNSYNLKYVWGANEAHSSEYVVDIENSHHCFLSHTMFNKSYYFENISCTKEEYENKVKEFQALSYQDKLKKIEKWKHEYRYNKVYPYHLSISFENSFGYGFLNVKNAINCYSLQECEDIKHSSNSKNMKDCQDVESAWGGNLMYEVNAAIPMTHSCFGFGNGGNYIYYSEHRINGNHLFGCIGLRNKSYCIFNKQYTQEEYEELVPRIIEKMMMDGEWGEFFPASLSPFGYNETVAQEYFPLSREEVLGDGRGDNGTLEHGEVFNWSDYSAPFPQVEKILPASRLPEDIGSIPDDILNWAIECEVSGRPFRIIRQELEFYRKHSIPIPRRHPDIRHMDRMRLRNPRKLFERRCDKCGKDIVSTYAPEREETVYCEGCYLESI